MGKWIQMKNYISWDSICFNCTNFNLEDLIIDEEVTIEAYCLNEKGIKTKYKGCEYYHKRT